MSVTTLVALVSLGYLLYQQFFGGLDGTQRIEGLLSVLVALGFLNYFTLLDAMSGEDDDDHNPN